MSTLTDSATTLPIAEELTWFTHAFHASGRQICSVRPVAGTQGVVLDLAASILLQDLLGEIARVPTLSYSEARQAVLRTFLRTYQPDANAP